MEKHPGHAQQLICCPRALRSLDDLEFRALAFAQARPTRASNRSAFPTTYHQDIRVACKTLSGERCIKAEIVPALRWSSPGSKIIGGELPPRGRGSPSTTWPGWTKRRRSSKRSSTSCATPRSSRISARRSPAGCSWSGRPGAARRCSPGRSRERPRCRSSPSPAASSSRCSSGSAPPECGTCSIERRKRRHVWCSSTRSTRWGGAAAPGSAAGTTSASRRSTSCWWSWTGSIPIPGSSFSPRPTGRTSSTRPCSDPDG